ncbi:hypothetical protein LCGC14_0516920 [marine sediment metagenome]|uniref:Uncharacterized protein n=1 Tax=marine sediment metagenome TaxID=412755 RepID=A0A0F9V7T9_9ZZZZ
MWTDGHLRAWESSLAQATWAPKRARCILAVVAIGVIAAIWGMFG